MIKPLILTALTIPLLTTTAVFAQSDQQLVDEVEKLQGQTSASTTSREYESFTSCEDFDSTLQEFLDNNKELFSRGGYYPYAIDDLEVVDFAMEDAVMDEAAPVAAPQARGSATSPDYSTTNLQVSGVDEPEILKTDGEFFYYYSVQLGKITILEYGNGLDGGDLSDALSSIQVPKTLSNIQLFLQDDTLTILANRRSQASGQGLLDDSQKTVVSVFDVSDPTNPKLDAFHDLDGHYTDSRMVDGQLTLITSLGVQRWRWYNAPSDRPAIDTLRPTHRSVVYDPDSTMKIADQDIPYAITTHRTDCSSIEYLFPTPETLEQSGDYPSFTTMYLIDTTSTDLPRQTTLFGRTDQIYMSQDNIYLTSSQYLPRGGSCPVGARCLFPSFGSQQTLIHKYERDEIGEGSGYEGSIVIDGAPLPQRSMSEGKDNEFRILTRQWSPESATHLTIIDRFMNLEGSLRNIEPGEEFKASRYIGDKLYLVTFEQIDPLFVIDLADSNDPEILGELKIPGYSTYLHPYGSLQDGVQHLIGLGYDTLINQRGGVQTAGVKVDLYSVDYNQSPLSIQQTHTLTMGDQDSRTAVADDPRQFVRNSNDQTLLLPVVLTQAFTGSNCQVFYDANGVEETRDCRETVRTETDFAGLKRISIDLEEGISETTSIDLQPLVSQFKNNRYGYYEEEWEDDIVDIGDQPIQAISSWMLRDLQMRAGYIGDESYLFTNQSVTFADGSQTESVLLDQ